MMKSSMTLSAVMTASFLSLSPSVSHAQFGDLLKGLKDAAKELEKGVQEGLPPPQPNQNSNNRSEQISKETTGGSISPLCFDVNKLSEQHFGFYENPPTQGKPGRVAMTKYLDMPKEYRDGIKDARFRSVTVQDRTWDSHIKDEALYDRLFDSFPIFAEWFKAYDADKGGCPWGKNDEELRNYISIATRTAGSGRDMNYAFSIVGAWNYKKTMDQQRVQNENKKFAASPEGKLKALRDHYTSMMAIQDCYDIRKNYVVKYVDATVYNNARSAMRQLEAKAKAEIPGLNTDREWTAATKEYAASAVGQSLAVNKKMPQNHTKDVQQMCNLMSYLLLNAVPADGPKKNF